MGLMDVLERGNENVNTGRSMVGCASYAVSLLPIRYSLHRPNTSTCIPKFLA